MQDGEPGLVRETSKARLKSSWTFGLGRPVKRHLSEQSLVDKQQSNT